MRTFEFNYQGVKGLPETLLYDKDKGVMTLKDARGAMQRKAYPEGQIVREYTNYSKQMPNTTTVVQPRIGVKGKFQILEDIVSQGSKKRQVLLEGIMNEYGDVIKISKQNMHFDEMVSQGKGLPNSIKKLAEKCFKFAIRK